MIVAMQEPESSTGRDFADELRGDVVAIRLAVTQFGRRRQMTHAQKAEVAQHFNASTEYVGASKRLFPVKRPELKAITAAVGALKRAWQSFTLPLAGVDAVRLIRKDQLQSWIDTYETLTANLNSALAAADDVYVDIVREARNHLGKELFDVRDYPEQLDGSVAVKWNTYNFEPSEDLLKLAPATYQREQQRVRRQFEASIAIFESECREEMASMVTAMIEKLTPSPDGKAKKFTESAATNLREFFDRFESLGVFSDEDLTKLIGEAKDALGGTTMQQLKRSEGAQREMKDQFQEIKTGLDALLVDRGERAIDLDGLED